MAKAKAKPQTFKPFGYCDMIKAATDKRRRSVLDSNTKPVSRDGKAASSVYVDNVATRHNRPKSPAERKAIRNMRPFVLDPAYAAWKGIA